MEKKRCLENPNIALYTSVFLLLFLNAAPGMHHQSKGNNTIGNKGQGNDSLRTELGNNVDIGVGAVIIGSLNIADNCIIGAVLLLQKALKIPL